MMGGLRVFDARAAVEAGAESKESASVAKKAGKGWIERRPDSRLVSVWSMEGSSYADESAIGCFLSVKTTLGEEFEGQVITYDRPSNILVLHILNWFHTLALNSSSSPSVLSFFPVLKKWFFDYEYIEIFVFFLEYFLRFLLLEYELDELPWRYGGTRGFKARATPELKTSQG